MTLRRRDFLTGSTALATLAGVGAGIAGGLTWLGSSLLPRTHSKTNIILVVTDDMRADAMGWTGNRFIHTPVLDQLAAKSLCFRNNFVTTSICPTSRASILTGLYASTHGVWDFNVPLPPNRLKQSFPILLKNAGYHTGFVGKWGLGTPDRHPRSAFDVWQGQDDLAPYMDQNRSPQHLTDYQAQLAVDFVKKCPPDKPFMLMLSFRAPHDAFEPAPRFAHALDGLNPPPPVTMTQAHFDSRPALVREHTLRQHEDAPFRTLEGFQNYNRAYYQLIMGIDQAMGNLLSHLDSEGLTENTCIVFTSDNGLQMGEFMRFGKTFGYEVSIRTPMMIALPTAMTVEKPMGAIEAMTLNIDIAPTLLELAGIHDMPPMHGRSLLAFAHNKTPDWRDDFLYEQYHSRWGLPRCEGVRNARMKYMRYFSEPRSEDEMFDLTADPMEETNLAINPAYAGQVGEMRSRFAQLKRQLQVVKPV